MEEKDIWEFKTTIYKHLDRILGADDKDFAKFVQRLLYVLAPHAEKSAKFKEIAGEIPDATEGKADPHEVLMALSYVMQESELSPPIRISGVLDADAINLMYKDGKRERK